MTFEVLTTFILLVIVFAIIPGPTVILVTALNPKDIMFFVAFLPQFVNSQSPELPQLIILMFTFLFIIALNISFYTIFAGKISHKIQNYNARKKLNRIGGGSLIGAGLITATIQRT